MSRSLTFLSWKLQRQATKRNVTSRKLVNLRKCQNTKTCRTKVELFSDILKQKCYVISLNTSSQHWVKLGTSSPGCLSCSDFWLHCRHDFWCFCFVLSACVSFQKTSTNESSLGVNEPLHLLRISMLACVSIRCVTIRFHVSEYLQWLVPVRLINYWLITDQTDSTAWSFLLF